MIGLESENLIDVRGELIDAMQAETKLRQHGGDVPFSAELSTNYSFNSFCLVEQGWLPLGLSIDVDTILLPD